MDCLNELGTWLNIYLPEVAADLRPGASEFDLSSFSNELGLTLPEDFLRLYTWHNGQDMKVNTGPWYGLSFLSLDRVRKECAMWRKVLQDSPAESLVTLARSIKSTPLGFVKEQYANEHWIPFAFDGAGNYLGVDLSPNENGTYGQVINFGRDEDRKIAIAPGVKEFVCWMLKELRSGNFNIKEESDGGRSFNTLRPEKYHFLDSLAIMFPRS
jgi:cell wall assembly regulator SMI1